MASRESIMAAHHRHMEQMVRSYYARPRRRPLMTFLYGYFDEAGKFHDKDGRICLVGFVSDGDRWNRFETEWFNLLAKHGFSAIHMNQFYSQSRARGWDETTANGVLAEFVDKIREHVQSGFGIAVDGKYFRHKFEVAGKPPRDPKRYYTHRLLKRIRDAYSDPSWHPLSLSITFDEDEESAVACYQIISRLRRDHSDLRELVSSVGFANDVVFTPLQAADILAHLTRERLLTGQM
ncbi:MAG: DUF3800 domain-containing protein, partial [Candidatus Binataceae bacterium]